MSLYLVVALALLAGSTCSAYSTRIIGGSPTTIEEYPSIVQVETSHWGFSPWEQGCGGTIITSRYVISAAHCFEQPLLNRRNRRFRAGATYRKTEGSVHTVSRVLNHPNYGPDSGLDFDLSLIRVSNPFVFSSTVQPIAIPPHGTIFPGHLPVVYAGWGGTIPDMGRADKDVIVDEVPIPLRHATAFTVAHEACRDLYLTLTNIIREDMICAGYIGDSGGDACQGDSGGPLYYGNILAGVISWGHGCGNQTFPGVNTNVGSFTDWIVENAV